MSMRIGKSIGVVIGILKYKYTYGYAYRCSFARCGYPPGVFIGASVGTAARDNAVQP